MSTACWLSRWDKWLVTMVVSTLVAIWLVFQLTEGAAKPEANAEVVWVKAGFKLGRITITDAGDMVFSKLAKGGLLAFRYSRTYDSLNLAALPPIQSPFGLFLDDSPIDDNFLRGLEKVGQVQSLCIRYGPVTDVGMKTISKLKTLIHLEISNVADDVSPASFNKGIAHLARLTDLKTLNLSWTGVADEAMNPLGDMKRLRTLNLRATRLTDIGLIPLARLSGLAVLDLRETHVTRGGLSRLKRALPKLRVLRDPG